MRMILRDFAFAFIVAFVLFLVFGHGLRRVGPFGGAIWFFIVVLLAAWVGGVWARPIGPAIMGVFWLPYLWFGLLIALVLASTSPVYVPPRRDRSSTDEGDDSKSEEVLAAAGTLSLFLWVLLLSMGIALIAHYTRIGAAPAPP